VVAAAAVVTATIGAGGSPGQPAPAAGVTAQTTAFVVSHAEQALAMAAQGALIERVTTTPPPRQWFIPFFTKGFSPRMMRSKITRLTTWSYRGRARTAGFGPDSRPVIDTGPATVARRSGPQPALRAAAADFTTGRWITPVRLPPANHLRKPNCDEGINLAIAPFSVDTAAHWTSVVSTALSCHLVHVTGHQRVGGVDTLRLAGTAALARQLPHQHVTLWVDSKTYLPVRLALNLEGNPDWVTDFRWIPPTPAGLHMLQVQAPGGLRHVRPPAGTAIGFGVANDVGQATIRASHS
jgi:hypothetical protein